MKPVLKYHSTILNCVYLSLCISGLSWQIVQISVNYFAFGVVSDIKILMPGIVEKKALNLCFRSNEMLNYSSYDELLEKYPTAKYEKDHVSNDVINFRYKFMSNRTLEERCNLIINPNEIFHIEWEEKYFGSKQFLIALYNCYQLYPISNESNSMIMQSPLEPASQYIYAASKVYMENITYMYVVLSDVNRLPWSEFATTEVVTDMLSVKGSTAFLISSQSYEIDKLKFPYTDHCIDYTIFGYADREERIRECMNEESIKTYSKASGVQIFEKEDILNGKYSRYGNYSILISESSQTMWKKCLSKYRYDDCHKKSMFTKLSLKILVGSKENITIFALSRSRNPSFRIISKARIDDIDFITYILGALGSWVGFSFLVLNPFPYIVKYLSMKRNRIKNNKEMKNIHPINKDEENISRIASIMLRNRISALEKRCEKLSNEMILLKSNMN